MQRLKTIFLMCLSGFWLAGCCSTTCRDCVPLSKMPYAIYDGGSKYLLIDHLSINEKIREYELLYGDTFESTQLRQKFPNNQALKAYLDGVDKRSKKAYDASEDEFWSIKSDLESSHGEFYDYRMLSKNGAEIEEGWLILSNGKIFKKFVTATDIVDKK
jgi:hypothetical protein